MRKRVLALLAAGLLLVSSGFAKDKKKSSLPPYVLQAHTVAVIIDPSAGMSVDDPQANTVAREDVEKALRTWGRYQTNLARSTADLLIVVRRGSGRLVNQTVADPRQNNRPGAISPTDSGVTLGAQRGQQPGSGGAEDAGLGRQGPHPQTEIGQEDDSFLVYQGGVDNPLDQNPTWRYVARDGLRPHSVPAVTEFRKAIVEAEKAAAKTP